MGEYRVLKREYNSNKITYLAQEKPTVEWKNIGEYDSLIEAKKVIDRRKAGDVRTQEIVYEI